MPELKDIKFEKGITVLALQPEIGKTYSFIKYCKENPGALQNDYRAFYERVIEASKEGIIEL